MHHGIEMNGLRIVLGSAEENERETFAKQVRQDTEEKESAFLKQHVREGMLDKTRAQGTLLAEKKRTLNIFNTKLDSIEKELNDKHEWLIAEESALQDVIDGIKKEFQEKGQGGQRGTLQNKGSACCQDENFAERTGRDQDTPRRKVE